MSRTVAATALVGAMLAFALPFGMVSSCGGAEVRFTGAELATYSVPGESHSDGELADDVESTASPLAIVAFGAAAAGLLLAVLGLSGVGACAWLGLVAMQLLLYAIAVASDGSDVYEGYGLALLGFVVAGVACLVGRIRSRRRSGASVWRPLGWALAALVPPLGLAASALIAAVLWIVRRSRARWRAPAAVA